MNQHVSNTTSTAGSGRLIFAGTALLLTGLAAIVFPFAVTLAVEIMIGIFLIAAGCIICFHAVSEKSWAGVLGEALIGLFYLVGGVVFLLNPFGGAVALTAALGIVFILDGITRCVLAFWLRATTNWILALLSGCLSIMIGVLVVAGLANGASLAFIGLLVGVNFVLAGAAFISLGWSRKDAGPEPAQA